MLLEKTTCAGGLGHWAQSSSSTCSHLTSCQLPALPDSGGHRPPLPPLTHPPLRYSDTHLSSRGGSMWDHYSPSPSSLKALPSLFVSRKSWSTSLPSLSAPQGAVARAPHGLGPSSSRVTSPGCSDRQPLFQDIVPAQLSGPPSPLAGSPGFLSSNPETLKLALWPIQTRLPNACPGSPQFEQV